MQEKKEVGIIDFEELCKLSRINPEEFERNRHKMINKEIARRPYRFQERLKKFQWVLDMKRRRCRNSLEACFMFHEMMMENVYGENGLLRNLERLVEAVRASSRAGGDGENMHDRQPPVKETVVLEFPAPGRSRQINCG